MLFTVLKISYDSAKREVTCCTLMGSEIRVRNNNNNNNNNNCYYYYYYYTICMSPVTGISSWYFS